MKMVFVLQVILRSPYIGIEFMDLSRYKQMVGRAGRAGFGGVGESILMCQFKDTSKVSILFLVVCLVC